MADNKSCEGKKTISVGTVTVNVDASDALKGLKAIQREARKAAAALKEFEEKQKTMNQKLLVIELENEESVPKVFYEGEEIKHKVNIQFNWVTKTDKHGKMVFNIQYAEIDDEGYPIVKGINVER